MYYKNNFYALIVLSLITSCSVYYKGAPSNHFDGKRFFDPHCAMEHKSLWSVFKWKINSKRREWPRHVPNQLFDMPPHRVEGSDLRVSAVGHATFLIQTHGLNILTDPIWSERASPLSFAGPKRIIDPGIKFDDLPPIDFVLVSHNHYDHLDLITLGRLWKAHQPTIITPLGNDSIIHAYCKDMRVVVGDWNDSIPINDEVIIYINPAQHWSSRSLFDRNKALWGSFTIVTPSGNIYFGGDTGYSDGKYFKDANNQFGPFRLALLPMGAYQPRWFMEYAHMDPEAMIRAHIDLGMPYTIPCHYDVFPLADEGYGEAIADLKLAQVKWKVDANIYLLGVGEAAYISLSS